MVLKTHPDPQAAHTHRALADWALPRAPPWKDASAIGTTVLQLKEIPQRPRSFDGALCIFGPADDLDDPKIRAALARTGRIVSVKPTPTLPHKWEVRFATHAEALAAKERCATMAALWKGLDTLYNERPYDDRGW